MKFSIQSFLLLLTATNSFAYYMHHRGNFIINLIFYSLLFDILIYFFLALRETNAEGLLKKFTVNFKTAEGEDYPSGFDYSFMTKEGKKFDLKFVQVGKLTNDAEYDANVFVRDDADGVERFESQVVSISIFILR
jgi:hypothetical protein